MLKDLRVIARVIGVAIVHCISRNEDLAMAMIDPLTVNVSPLGDSSLARLCCARSLAGFRPEVFAQYSLHRPPPRSSAFNNFSIFGHSPPPPLAGAENPLSVVPAGLASTTPQCESAQDPTAAAIVSIALKVNTKGRRGGVTIAADWDPTTRQTPSFATRTC